jgi:hypothetical protein
MLLHKHSKLLLCSKFKIFNPSNKSQRCLMLLQSNSTLFLRSTVVANWKFSCSFSEFLKDFNYCFPLEGLRQKLELLYHTLQEFSTMVLVWELVTWNKVNDFFSKQSKDQWKILSPQIDKTNGPHPPKHNFHSTPLAMLPMKELLLMVQHYPYPSFWQTWCCYAPMPCHSIPMAIRDLNMCF